MRLPLALIWLVILAIACAIVLFALQGPASAAGADAGVAMTALFFLGGIVVFLLFCIFIGLALKTGL